MILCLLALSIGMIHLRTCLNRLIFEASVTLEERSADVHELERQVVGLETEIDRLTDFARLGPRAEQLGLVPPTPETVSLLPPSSALVAKGARPLPGAGALGRLIRRATSLTGAARAVAAKDDDRHQLTTAASTQRVTPAPLQVASPSLLAAASHNDQCKFCRQLGKQRSATAHP